MERKRLVRRVVAAAVFPFSFVFSLINSARASNYSTGISVSGEPTSTGKWSIEQ